MTSLCEDRFICTRSAFFVIQSKYMHFLISLYWGGDCQIHPHHFSKLFYFKNIKLYNANQCVWRRHKNKHWSEWATFEEYWYPLEYKAPLISTSTNFLQPSQIYVMLFFYFYRATLCQRGSCVRVRHKSEFYWNGWTSPAGFWYGSFFRPILHCYK